MIIRIALKALLLIIFSLGLVACSGSNNNDSNNFNQNSTTEEPTDPGPETPTPPPSEVPNEIARGDLTAEGGTTITVPDGAAGFANTTIEIPPDAAIDNLHVQVGYEDEAPGPFRAEANDAGVTPVSKTIVLHVTGDASSYFNKPVAVTMPYDTEIAGDLPPAVVYWDPDAQRYRPVSVIAIDRDAGMVTFRTSHFSKFMAVIVEALRVDLPDVDTGFRLGTDSILHQNFGSYKWGGHCAAFASMSTYYYSAGKPTQLYAFAQEGADEQPVDDEMTRTALALTYSLIADKWASVAANLVIPSASDTGLLMVTSMIVTGDPIHLVLHNGSDVGHSVTIFAYDKSNARFRIYDSNFPKNEVTFDYNLLTGFGSYSRAASYPADMFANIGYATDDTFGAPAQFRKIVDDWVGGNLQDFFDNLDVTEPGGTAQALSFGQDVTAIIPYEDNQEVSVHFTRPSGSSATVYMHVYLDGVKQSPAAPAIAGSGDYKLMFPTKLENKVEVMLIVSEHPRSVEIGFSAYGKFNVQPEGKNFFVNFGFETGDSTGWESGTSLRSSGRDWTPTKLTIQGVGFDPIATDIPTAVFGQYAARVNDSDPNYHVTYIRQKAVVPSTGNPQVIFQWAAVLQDPQHTPEDQPYVDVVLRNTTTDTEIYRKRFYTNDPSFTGWAEYDSGRWKAIPWQSVLLTGLSAYAGDEIELRIDGADCDRGGHGGYVYLDGEE